MQIIINNRGFLSILFFKLCLAQGFLRCFRDPSRVPRIENQVPRIRGNYHRVLRIGQNRVPRIREIGSLQIHTGYVTFSLKKTGLAGCSFVCLYSPIIIALAQVFVVYNLLSEKIQNFLICRN